MCNLTTAAEAVCEAVRPTSEKSGTRASRAAQAELEREHLSEFCLAAENSAALDASMKRLEKMLERKLEAEAALNMPFCREVAVQKMQDDVESAPKSPKLRAACPEALKKLAYLTEEVNSKEGEVLASLSSLQMVVADDRERLLLR